jgi:mannose/cellobiose epimerase-like protein (N-acyl-D-glucosamine 2-epimerase family)
LREDFRDARYGGWYSRAGSPGDKRAYEHVFVVLAAASAGDHALLSEALAVLDAHFWEEPMGALRDVCSRDWRLAEPYRGANANMHGVEAMVATGDPRWRERALRITRRLAHGPYVIEHFDAAWRPLPHYNDDDRAHRFRPYGITPGHGFEWARLAFGLGLEAEARTLFDGALRLGWDGSGFVYTVDWNGRPVVRQHLHWVLCEAIAAAAVLGEREREQEWWELAERHFIDREHGSWHHELDPSNRPAATIWDGKPDVYHALGAVAASLR